MTKTKTTTTYALGSNGLVYAPGVVRWAINGYAWPKDRKHVTNVLIAGWSLPKHAAVALLSRKAEFRLEGDKGNESVVFSA